MFVVKKANDLLAEFAIFPVDPDKQTSLVEQVIHHIESTLKQSGVSAAAVFRSRDGLRVTSYIQWKDQASYAATQPISGFVAPDVHLFDIFDEEPEGSELSLYPGMDGLINFGIFKLKQPGNQPRFIELFRQSLRLVSGQPGLISTHAHRSLDGWRCINFGHWRSVEDFSAMDSDRPFSSLFGEMLDLAENEYQKTLHEAVFTT